MTLAAGLLVLVILALITVSMTGQALPAFAHEGLGFLTSSKWDPTTDQYGALALLWGTAVVSAIGLCFAVPLSVGIALFIQEVAPRSLRKPAIYFIDLLAAIPSVVFGLWGSLALAEWVQGPYEATSHAVSGIPLVDVVLGRVSGGKNYLTAGLVVALMITPIITSVAREVFATVPSNQKHAALALGMTRWEMMRAAVFPHSRSGIVGAVMLGLGRALGETIAVALVIGDARHLVLNVFAPGNTMAAKIATSWGEAEGLYRSALVGLGVALFALTILVNFGAQWVVGRGVRKAGEG